MAYLCRYGHQPLSEVLALPREDAFALARALGRIIERESETPEP